MGQQGLARVDVYRGSLVESSHQVHVAIVDVNGQLLWSAGNPRRITYARSAAKPFQAVPIVTSGAYEKFGFDEADLALCTASHNGEAQHATRVSAILQRLDCVVDDLVCGAHPPIHAPAYVELQRTGGAVSAIHNNCSGKHTGMLAVAKAIGAPTSHYDHPDHPVQQMIHKVIAEVSGVGPEDVKTSTDGCGVVVFGLPLTNLALAFSRLARPVGISAQTQQALEKIRHAMTCYPFLVAGTNRMCTALMTVLKGQVVVKAGAEGVYGIGLIDSGIGIAVKVEDGADRAAAAIVPEVLRWLGRWTDREQEELETLYSFTLRNVRGDAVGSLRGQVVLERHAQ